MKTVSFDFDSCLITGEYRGEPNHDMLAVMRVFHAAGFRIIITTARNPERETPEFDPNRLLVKDFIAKQKLPVDKVVFTNHHINGKGPFLKNEGAIIHFDDRDDELASAIDHGVLAVKVHPVG